jgi:hypothetical protein
MLLANLIIHVAMDASHVICLKYLSSLARSLGDAIKLGVMWLIGKGCWIAGSHIYRMAWPANGGLLEVFAEPIEPKSWMMIPALIVMAYAMLMFKFRVWAPIRLERQVLEGEGLDAKLGGWRFVLREAELTEEEKKNHFLLVDTGTGDGFYTNVFHNKKIRKIVSKALGPKKEAAFDNIRSLAPEKRSKWQISALRASQFKRASWDPEEDMTPYKIAPSQLRPPQMK